MRICLLGDFTGNPDEGMKNVSNTIRERMALKHDILALNPREIFNKRTIKNIRSFQPEIIHYIHGPTIRSLVLLQGLTIILGNKAKLISSATRPYFSRYSKWTIPLLKPDLILTQSSHFESFFKERGCRVEFLPNGVDCKKFAPVSEIEKFHIRNEFGLPENKNIILHVGHIKANRKLEVFKEIQKIDSIQVVIVGGTAQKSEDALKRNLQAAGIKICHEYYEDISKIYKMADLYVFPIRDTGGTLPDTYNQVGAIDLPLSVLEAMACNLPVITTRFGALQRLFKAGDGLQYAEDEAEIIAKVKNFSFKNVYETRQKVLPYDWDRIVVRIELEYQDIIRKIH